ncbi:hypothetical protein ACXYTJ_07820 [Gilvimarinus sp. F26214L]|uniref:hypothetical protein n=1 Tax=Gilvimarinus sp. DZF01 TaxID=3461371 RepID=UPI0040451D4A
MNTRPTKLSTQFAARLMLVLAVLQLVFVSFEIAGVVHGPEENTVHHEQFVADGFEDAGKLDFDSASDPVLDTCDHCCHCHGHGTHFSPLSNQSVPSIDAAPAYSALSTPQFQSLRINSINRPPIA